MSEQEVIVTELTDEELMSRLVPKEEPATPEPTPEPVQEPVPEPTPEPKPEPIPEPEPTPPIDEEVKITKTEYDKLVKRIEEKEKFIQRQAAEVGARRKSEEQLRSEIFQLQQVLQTKWNDPLEATDIQDQIRDRQSELREAETRTVQERNQNVVKTFVKEPENLIDDMVDLLREDGNDADSLRMFRDNPYREPPGTLINLAKRAELRRESRNKDAKIASLEAEIQTLKTKPQETIKKIEKALKEPTPMNNAAGQATANKKEIDATQIISMSDKEIEQALKERLAAENTS